MIASLKLFKKEIPNKNLEDFKKVNMIAIKKGYLVTAAACTRDTLDYIQSISVDPNATFYKEWQDIFSRTRFELFEDQIRHYLSTYGTNFEGKAYVPNDGADVPVMKNLVIIDTITPEEASTRAWSMVTSGIALKDETLNDIKAVLDGTNFPITPARIGEIKNKEFKMRMYREYGHLPKDPVELVRYIVYRATGNALLIKSPEVLETISGSWLNANDFINEENIKEVASVFYRFKPIFLMLRKANSKNRPIINKLRALAKKYHKPMVQDYWSTALISEDQQLEHIDELTNFRKVSILEEIFIRTGADLTSKPYIIRNGKLFIDKEYKRKEPTINSFVLYQSLVSSLIPKACKVKLPKNIVLTVPKSEKSFIGEYPLYSHIDMIPGSTFGIYWREEGGADDLDLSELPVSGGKVGWNACYSNNGVTYSGDMTSARPEATELLRFDKDAEDGLLKVNCFSGNDDSKYNFFVAKVDISKPLPRNYMVDPNDILFTVSDTISGEKCPAIIVNGKLYLANVTTGMKSVSDGGDGLEYITYLQKTAPFHLTLEVLLRDSGFTIVYDDEECDIDLSNPTKDQIINLLA